MEIMTDFQRFRLNPRSIETKSGKLPVLLPSLKVVTCRVQVIIQLSYRDALLSLRI